jgi:sterol desaturase/sphingolipid hydroxylase (fatty acid hydroxylase superfamily)
VLLFLANHEALVVNGSYVLFFLIFTLWEFLKPGFVSPMARAKRWPHNLILLVMNRVILQLTSTLLLGNFAYLAWKNGWGLLNQFRLNPFLNLFLSFLILDFFNYLQHFALHKYTFLWRIHRLHHADPMVDISTSARFHPFEPLYYFLLGFPIIYLFGPSFIVVFLMNATNYLFSLFMHANIDLPPLVDRPLRWFISTPAMHHIHHSRNREEADTNYATMLTCWDRLFRTYRAEPKIPYKRMEMGLEGWDSPQDLQFHRLLIFPFLEKRNDADRLSSPIRE